MPKKVKVFLIDPPVLIQVPVAVGILINFSAVK